jgi:hypothetical protein
VRDRQRRLGRHLRLLDLVDVRARAVLRRCPPPWPACPAPAERYRPCCRRRP